MNTGYSSLVVMVRTIIIIDSERNICYIMNE